MKIELKAAFSFGSEQALSPPFPFNSMLHVTVTTAQHVACLLPLNDNGQLLASILSVDCRLLVTSHSVLMFDVVLCHLSVCALLESVLVEKCLGQRMCSQYGKNFNVASINVKGENESHGISMAQLLPPSQCVSKLITWVDDTEAVVKECLRVYHEKSQPLEEFYREQAKLL